MKPIVIDVDCSTNSIIEREMTDEEYAAYLIQTDIAEVAVDEAETL